MDCCYLEIDVNGEGFFVVDKGVLTSYSGKLGKLLHKAKPMSNLKVIVHDLPGGAEGFELMTRFCYQSGRFPITPSNLCLLLSVAHFMEMTEDIHPRNLIEQTEQFMQGIAYWTWMEVLAVLKQCQQLYPSAASSGLLLGKCLDSLVQRIGSPSSEGSVLSASPDSGSFRLSCDTKSTESTKPGSHRSYWYEELVVLRPGIIDMLVRVMISHRFDHQLISRFLFYYFKSRVPTVESTEKAKIVETVIDLVFLLDPRSIGCKSLLEVLRVASSLSVSKCCKDKLEKMIGLRLDQATLDNLLVSAPIGLGYLYDVDIVLRFLKTFISQASLAALKKVAYVVDLYISEVAPDPRLKPTKFIDLAKALPDSARDSSDQMYSAMDMYLQVHSELSVVEKMEVCCVLNCEKLSKEASNHLTHNPKFHLGSTMQDISSQQMPESRRAPSKPDRHIGPSDVQNKGCEGHSGRRSEHELINNNQEVLRAKSLRPLAAPSDDDLVTHLEKMQLRVKELEKTCRKLQAQMSKMKKYRFYNGRMSLPRLCS